MSESHPDMPDVNSEEFRNHMFNQMLKMQENATNVLKMCALIRAIDAVKDADGITPEAWKAIMHYLPSAEVIGQFQRDSLGAAGDLFADPEASQFLAQKTMEAIKDREQNPGPI